LIKNFVFIILHYYIYQFFVLVVPKMAANARVYEPLRLPAIAMCGGGLPKRLFI